MNQQTINDALTIGGAQALLANRYRVVRQLGQGGMGSVYLAEDTQLDNFKVAIKMLPAILAANKRALKQLKAEALVSMKLVHSNIVPLRGFEENNGNPFLVMDYIEGQTLDDLLAEKEKLTEDEAMHILAPVAAALDYAHAKGVIHRDVKPGNVMIDKDGTPYVLDFGIAREIQETMTRVTGRTISGTLTYMSPEQLVGASPKSAQDVYSFAVMAYECLKGEPPFTHGNIEYQIMNILPPLLPEGTCLFASTVMAGLAKKPEDRPLTCAAVLAYKPLPQEEAASQIVTITASTVGHAVASAGTARRSVHGKVQLWEGGPYWADTNIGAEESWEYGYYFWWGDIIGYKRENNVWVATDGSSVGFQFHEENVLTNNKNIRTLQSEGWIGENNVLTMEHDSAQVFWGGEWRMPTNQELNNLCKKCDWAWTTTNGVTGYVVHGKGDFASAKIFLPAAGYGDGTSLNSVGSYGYYWSSVPNSGIYACSWSLYFDSGYHYHHYMSDHLRRYYGRPVRPVQGFTK